MWNVIFIKFIYSSTFTDPDAQFAEQQWTETWLEETCSVRTAYVLPSESKRISTATAGPRANTIPGT